MSKFTVTLDGQTFEVSLDRRRGLPAVYHVRVDGVEIHVIVPVQSERPEDIDWLIIDGKPFEVSFESCLHAPSTNHRDRNIRTRGCGQMNSRPLSLDGRVKSPIPGLISRVLVAPGQAVEIGQPLLVLEAMKMQNEICAACGGVVERVYVQPGQRVGQSELLAEIGQAAAEK